MLMYLCILLLYFFNSIIKFVFGYVNEILYKLIICGLKRLKNKLYSYSAEEN